jgi:hypothetical protein
MAPVVSAKTAKGSVFLAQPQFVGGVRDSIVFFFSRKLQSVGSPLPSPLPTLFSLFALYRTRRASAVTHSPRARVCVLALLS